MVKDESQYRNLVQECQMVVASGMRVVCGFRRGKMGLYLDLKGILPWFGYSLA